uniref:CSP11 n=1 Tax=Corythucha ciliata TaxID=369451 RepID=A0A3G2YV19_CORCT|nr:CSP11 [Corythucha ciliata]
MKLFLLLAGIVAVAWSRPDSHYTDKWDHIDVEEVIESDKLLKGYVNCLMDRGRCTPDGKSLKETLPDALEKDCSKCTEIQKEKSDKVIKHLVNKRPDYWNELSSKYDPNHIYQDKYKDKIDSIKEKA